MDVPTSYDPKQWWYYLTLCMPGSQKIGNDLYDHVFLLILKTLLNTQFICMHFVSV